MSVIMYIQLIACKPAITRTKTFLKKESDVGMLLTGEQSTELNKLHVGINAITEAV